MKSFVHSMRFNPLTIGAARLSAKAAIVFCTLFALMCIICQNVLEHTFYVPSLRLFVVAPEKKSLDEQISEALGEMNTRLKKLDDIEKSVGKNRDDYEAVTKLIADIQKVSLETRKQMLETRAARVRRGGEVSDGCARFLGALGLIAALKTPSADLKEHQIETAHKHIKEILGLEGKSALTTSDIPLPTQYSGEIVELVYEFGSARKHGTVFPLGAGTVKLPKLTTDPTFGLIAGSGSVGEKSPQLGFVTFNAEKFGGLIRLPSEIDEDSIVAMGQFIARYGARQIAYVEDYQFFRSSGAASGINGTAEGLTTAVVTDSCFVYNGGASNSGKTKQSEATLADFRAMRNASGLSGVVLNRAKYYVHPTYEALFVTFNTSATVTPYQRANGSAPATLDGFEIVWEPTMPAYSTSVSASLVHALFGDVSYQYFAPRGSVRFDTSREAAFATDEILIRVLERLTVGLMATKAVAGLRNSAT